MPSQPQTVITTYAISFDKEERALMRHGHEGLRDKFLTLRVGRVRFGNEQCRDVFYEVYHLSGQCSFQSASALGGR
jgi:hypothetical protein